MDGAGLPHYHTKSIPTEEDMLEAIKSYPLSNIPNYQPLYSNTGFALLGMACTAANLAHEGASAPKTYPELIRRDIFEPLGMDSSSFNLADENRDRIAVASTDNDDLVSLTVSSDLLSHVPNPFLLGRGLESDEPLLWRTHQFCRSCQTDADLFGPNSSRLPHLSILA